ncbi:MAG: hypothetical protein GY761_09165 [Hyphomicrobiales bacterium]|nr:hypothetical protein [Hyphomicrobiales bacterium]
MVIAILAVQSGLYLLFVYGLMYLTSRFLHRNVAIAVGVSATLFVLYLIIDQATACNAEPEYIPPAPGEEGVGTMIFACDSIGGAIAYSFIYMIGPITVALCPALVWRFWLKTSSG